VSYLWHQISSAITLIVHAPDPFTGAQKSTRDRFREALDSALLAEELGSDLANARVLILGVTYRGDVKETAFSGAFAVARELARRGAAALATALHEAQGVRSARKAVPVRVRIDPVDLG